LGARFYHVLLPIEQLDGSHIEGLLTGAIRPPQFDGQIVPFDASEQRAGVIHGLTDDRLRCACVGERHA
jgi:hypothetical protein